ncbi:MAG: hypothetical protein WBV95_00465 [Desulfobacterales bacterium]
MTVRKGQDRWKRIIAWTVLVLLLIVAGGCSKWSGGGPSLPSAVKEPASAYDKRLKRKIGVVPFRMESIFGDPTTIGLFQDNLLRAIQEECTDILFIKPGDGDFPEALVKLPLMASGAIDNFSLAMTGRRFGFNAILVGKITSINVDEKTKGFWFFRSSHYYAQVEALIELYDTSTATKIFDRTLSHKIEVEEPDAELIRAKNRIDSSFIEPSLAEIIDDVKDNICKAIELQAWKSYIVATDATDILIAAGSRSNVQAGDIFEVYDSRQAIEGYGGHRYLPPGPKVGEIEVKSVSEDTARAVSVSGSGFQAGQGLRLKK